MTMTRFAPKPAPFNRCVTAFATYSYSFGIVLDRTTVIFGIVCMVLVVLLMEGLGGLLRALKPRQNQLFK